MQTQAILNPASVAPISTQAARQPDAPSSEVPFHQVLSREVADRNGPSDTAQANPKETNNASSSSQAPAKAENTKPAKSAEEGKAGEASESKEPAIVDEAAAPSSATADMLALVANLGQTAAVQIDPRATATAATPALAATLTATAATTTASTAVEAASLAVDADRLRGAEKPSLTDVHKQVILESTSASDASAKETKVKPVGDFSAAMAQIKELKQTVDTTQFKASDSQPNGAAGAQPATDLGVVKSQEMQPSLSAAALAPLQQAVLDNAHALAGHSAEKLTPRVGSPGWDQALGQKVVWMVAGAQQSASLSLNPPDLGPLQVVLNVNNAQATATFVSAQPEVRQALETAMPKLREMLGDAGIQLGQTTVSTGMPNQNGGPGEQQNKPSSRGFDGGGDTDDMSIRAIRTHTLTGGQGLVDTFA